ncbi:unnamed protein product [Medioppia subpectinata]|uniref:Uncharacterized protein n=1 Tax=Medioppia subpectinata TaxID=1979941 RepID=A0A7R9KF33_9ACAR|nr:unnamed protein product [Medioppia subpectinata]CAG2102387.1 unnamed protein product [Medioppia subpectinata]
MNQMFGTFAKGMKGSVVAISGVMRRQWIRKYNSYIETEQLIHTLDRKAFIEDLSDADNYLSHESDVSLLNTKYFTEETLELLNARFRQGFIGGHIGGHTHKDTDNIPLYISKPGIHFTSQSLRELRETARSVANKEFYFYETVEHIVNDDIEEENRKNKVEQFVDTLFRMPLFEAFRLYRRFSLPIRLDTSNEGCVRMACVPDFVVKRNDRFVLNIEVKADKCPQLLDRDVCQTVAQAVACAQHNRANSENPYLARHHSLLIRGTHFHFLAVEVSEQYLRELSGNCSDSDSDANTPLNIYRLNDRALDFCDPNDRRINIL